MTMNDDGPRGSLGGISTIRRRSVPLSQQSLIVTGRLEKSPATPLVVRPALDGVDLVGWATGNRAYLEDELSAHGAVLFRGFILRDTEEFEALVSGIAGELLEYKYRSTPRTRVGGGVYTSTEYPADQTIPQHNEMAYSREWPLKIFFYSVQVAGEGGATPLADSRAVYRRISAGVREEFERRSVMYVRNYIPGVDLPWQDVFQTSDRGVVEAFCDQVGITWEWIGRDHLRTSQVCQAVAVHPRTRESVWFNQAHLFHVSSLPADVQDVLQRNFGDSLPRTACFGDGGELPTDALDEVRAAYDAEIVRFPWEPGDVLMVDNMLMTHGREPFRGTRKVVAAMAQPWSAEADAAAPVD